MILLCNTLRAALLAAALSAPLAAHADAGHDHGEEGAATIVAGSTAPHFEASSDRFEVVGRVEGDRLRLWLDNWATNAPVDGARVELTVGTRKVAVAPQPDGSLLADLPEADRSGTYPIAVSVRGAGDPALLGASLRIGAKDVDDHAGADAPPLLLWGGGVALVVLLAVAGAMAMRRRRRMFGALGLLGAVMAAGLLVEGATPANAHEGHDEPAPANAGGAPDQAVRLADGDILAPKPMQRLIGLRTVVTGDSATAGALALTGVVIPDPNGNGVVQASAAGRLSGRLPALGERVSAGQALAQIAPALDSDVALAAARGAAETALAEARLAAGPGGFAAEAAELAQAQARLARLSRLEGVVPDREIADARTAAAAAQARLSLARAQAAARLAVAQAEAGRLQRGASGAETLRAPVSGVISAVSAVQGQVVSPGETVFTIINPELLLVEARAPTGLAAPLSETATARTADGRSVTLARQGEGLSLVNGAAPLRFRVELTAGLKIGEPVTVFVARSQAPAGVALPREAVTRGPNGQTVVFIKESAERFAPIAVTVEDLDADRVTVTAGLGAGQRVATSGASLLAQVR